MLPTTDKEQVCRKMSSSDSKEFLRIQVVILDVSVGVGGVKECSTG